MFRFLKPKAIRSPSPRVSLKSSSQALRFYPSSHLTAPLFGEGSPNSFSFSGANRGDFYRFLRDRIPIVSSGIWTWVHLCATRQNYEIKGDESAIRQAQVLIRDLQRRVHPRKDGDVHGLERLTESFFLELFTLGRFAAQVHLLPDRSGISHVEMIDPYRLFWKKAKDGRLLPYLEGDNDELHTIQPELFFHRTLFSDLSQPQGVEPLASIPFVIEIEQRMLDDMARSSHHAGTPRLQVKITPPAANSGEDRKSYHSRINRYFDRTIEQFQNLQPDDNIFTWSDVEVEVVGGPANGESWKLSREQVIEDVITGLKLFPWVLGRSHGTTKNWIFAQYNLLMQIVDSVQLLGGDFAEWLIQLELRLRGNPCSVDWQFTPNQDPFIVERNRAKLMNLERIDKMVQAGYISKDQAKRELGV
ncbi:hypothetical protein K8I28_16020 [bacterium]|nr:hypothetical protein [bacterium]